MRDRLDQLLAEMETEIGQLKYLDEDRRQHLRELASRIEETLKEDSDSYPPEKDHEWSLNESVLMFEEEFPKLATILREIQQVLVNIGV